jgi:methylenetetrahydrofolate--tRNA-(uracil-5-)-methyltransferase
VVQAPEPGELGVLQSRDLAEDFGLLPPVTIKRPEGASRWRGADKAIAKRKAMSERALEAIRPWA